LGCGVPSTVIEAANFPLSQSTLRISRPEMAALVLSTTAVGNQPCPR
jgi:hypothetical protein